MEIKCYDLMFKNNMLVTLEKFTLFEEVFNGALDRAKCQLELVYFSVDAYDQF